MYSMSSAASETSPVPSYSFWIQIEALKSKMAMGSYQERTPEEVKAADADKLAKAEAELESARHHAMDMRRLLDS
jgi:hypothetical protein